MIRFNPPPEPLEFDQKARQPGNNWLAKNPDNKRPRDYWSPFKSNLADGFGNLCGYSVMYEPQPTYMDRTFPSLFQVLGPTIPSTLRWAFR